ncbi:protein kinase family protein [Halonotius terrestris]|uniref:non-specific serine/threonine protein kinase n=1 Tax=Halonotius terrestris TaxID=2487750 RepID=A0A8J8PB34_9EURY|nr:RIO1 family regulatory kinase/ATPase [Halonotius terrestris]TQQ83238.1 protein kinase family protein [Halonotius terrestris]
MLLRRLVRGRISWGDLERVVQAVADRYDRSPSHARFLDADNWLSTPVVIDEELFVKIISQQNTLVHALFTTGRNLGAFSSGTAGFFESFQTPAEMARHELEATREMRDLGLNTPEPKEAFEVDGYGIVVFEYLPEFRALDDLDPDTEASLATELFAALATLHDAGLAHGDLRAENVLIRGDDLYFIDATSVDSEAREAIRSYDLACGLAALEPILGARATVDAALESYSISSVLDAADFLGFVSIRPDHDFAAAALKSEIEKAATDSQRV